MKTRDYQDHAIECIFEYFTKYEGNPVVALPPGTGKSVVIGSFIQRVFSFYPGQRIMMLTHVKELIEQNFDKLITMWPTAPAGIYSAGIGRKDSDRPIVYGGIASVKNSPDLFGHVDLLLIDESHLVSPRDGTMYQTFIASLKEVNPNLKVIGFTATAYRLGQGMITDDGLFTDMCCDLTTLDNFNWFFDQGYLTRIVPKRTAATLNVDGVRLRGGEFVTKDLQQAVDQHDITVKAVTELLQYGGDRNHCLIFAAGLEHAEHVAEILDSFGVTCAVVHSKMPIKERNRIIAAFEAGEYWALVNNGILTTGYDFPAIDLLGILRPSSSPGLWVQILGRGIRPVYADGFDLTTREGRLAAIAAGPKPDCLVMDFAGNTARLGPINDPIVPQKPGKKGPAREAPVRICEACDTYNHASARVCCSCGEEFPRYLAINQTAGTGELIAGNRGADEPKVEVFKVSNVIYSRHRKQGKPDAIKVSYYCGLRCFSEYVCIEHEGYAGKKARNWWRDRDRTGVPETTDDALASIEGLPTATHIRVWINKKYPEILNYDYTGRGFTVSEDSEGAA